MDWKLKTVMLNPTHDAEYNSHVAEFPKPFIHSSVIYYTFANLWRVHNMMLNSAHDVESNGHVAEEA